MTREALKLALEFIERVNKDGWILADFEPQMYATITAIKEALASQRTWVGLTDEDKQDWIKCMPWPPEPGHIMVLIEGIESELKEKNT